MLNKVSIIGCGAVGSTLAFHLLSRLKLKELALVDIAADMARGIALDLEDTRAILGCQTIVAASGDHDVIAGSDVVVFAAGIPRKDGMSRQDLFKTNVAVARQAASFICKLAPQAIVIAVSNPLDAITVCLLKETGFDRHRVMGMGASLDTFRLLNLLSQATGRPVSELEGLVFGLHNNDMIVSAARMKAGGRDMAALLDAHQLAGITDRVKNRGSEIVKFMKTRSAYFAPSLACSALIEAIDANAGVLMPVSVFLEGEYGLNGVCLAVPCVINRQGIAKIVEVELSGQEKAQLAKAKDYYNEFKVCTT